MFAFSIEVEGSGNQVRTHRPLVRQGQNIPAGGAVQIVHLNRDHRATIRLIENGKHVIAINLKIADLASGGGKLTPTPKHPVQVIEFVAEIPEYAAAFFSEGGIGLPVVDLRAPLGKVRAHVGMNGEGSRLAEDFPQPNDQRVQAKIVADINMREGIFGSLGEIKRGNTEGIPKEPHSLDAPQGRGWRIVSKLRYGLETMEPKEPVNEMPNAFQPKG